MKAQGVSESDPELMRARGILQSIQQKTELLKRQQAQRQQQLKAQQQAALQQNGVAPAQPQPVVTASASTAPSQPPTAAADGTSQLQQSAAPSTNGVSQTAPAQATPAQLDGSSEQAFSKEQIMTLRAQMQAFAALQKNMPIPQQIQDRIFPSRQEQKAAAVPEVVATANKVLDEAAKTATQTTSDAQADGKPRHKFETFTDPHSLLLKNISYADHTHRPYRTMIPSIMPLGVDPERVREERENMIYNRVVARRQELAKMSANIGAWDTSKSDVPTDNTNAKLRNLIEYKMLCLLPKQREMRQKISKEMALSTISP